MESTFSPQTPPTELSDSAVLREVDKLEFTAAAINVSGADAALRNADKPKGALQAGWEVQYEMLNAWRGLAAIAVVVSHLAVWTFPIGPTAVMLFFVISGYCITASAESSRRRGVGFKDFMTRRIRRIYPPYLFSLFLFAVTRVVKMAQGGENQLARTSLEWLQNLTLSQWMSLLLHPIPYAADNKTLFVSAYWSLNYEEQFYLVIGLMLATTAFWRLNLRLCITMLVGCGLVWNTVFPQRSYGVFIEYWAHFGMGCLLFYRLCSPTSVKIRRITDGSTMFVALLLVFFTWAYGLENIERNGFSVRSVVFELAIVFSFVLLLIVTRPLDGTFKKSLVGRGLISLGTITYSLYLVHQFNLSAVAYVANRIVPSEWPPLVSLSLQVLLHIMLAVPFWFLCERPFLNKKPLSSADCSAAVRG